MGLDLLPDRILKKYTIAERHHACSILQSDFPEEFQDIIDLLDSFWLLRSDILTKGGRLSPMAAKLDSFLQGERGWKKKRFDIQLVIDGESVPMPTHEIDNFRNRVGVEVEWNNKTEFYDRDLNNFRLLWELRVISVGVIT